jgi:hypothetical protein
LKWLLQGQEKYLTEQDAKTAKMKVTSQRHSGKKDTQLTDLFLNISVLHL